MTAVTKIDEAENVLPADPLVEMIGRVAMDPDLPLDRMTALMDMRERQMNKEAEQVFNQAFAAAMGEMPDVPRSGKNNHTGNKYSTLDDLIRTTRPILAAHGLSLNWQTEINENEIRVTAIVRHALGHSISATLSGPRDSGKQMNVLQGGGSTETYLKRYSGFGILGLSSGDEVDDDGRQSRSGAKISEQQWEELRDLLDKAKISEDIVCTAEKIEILAELPATKFGKVKSNLLTNIKRLEDA